MGQMPLALAATKTMLVTVLEARPASSSLYSFIPFQFWPRRTSFLQLILGAFWNKKCQEPLYEAHSGPSRQRLLTPFFRTLLGSRSVSGGSNIVTWREETHFYRILAIVRQRKHRIRWLVWARIQGSRAWRN